MNSKGQTTNIQMTFLVKNRPFTAANRNRNLNLHYKGEKIYWTTFKGPNWPTNRYLIVYFVQIRVFSVVIYLFI